MFTGIIEGTGRIAAFERGADGARLVIDVGVMAESVAVGDSVALNGVCLTVVKIDDSRLAFEAVPETLNRTNLGDLKSGDAVNLERPVRAGGRLDGHIVQGHVDGVGVLVDVAAEGDSWRLGVQTPADLLRYLVEKGSIALDGISLTVAGLREDGFEVVIIPHTWEVTNLSRRSVGERLNLEVDILAKYVERLLAGQRE